MQFADEEKQKRIDELSLSKCRKTPFFRTEI